MPEESVDSLIEKLLRQRMAEQSADVVVDAGRRIADLKKRLDDFQRPVEFKPGNVVRWKPNLKNKTLPRYDEPAIVIEMLKEPQLSTAESGSAYFREPLDLILGIIDSDNDFVLFHYDSRRFEGYEEATK